ncbi:MAG: PQQ-dependent sugar dehydrogenase [Actinomycetota bacterium]|nr:PQQ-dependent sugar dehydrogenase [Actinomycetota bacterium]
MRKVATAILITLSILSALPQTSSAAPKGAKVARYKGGLNFPIDMARVPRTKTIFFTEKTGRIRVMHGRKLVQRPCAKLDVASDGERGLLGIALHPNYKKNHFLYVYYVNASPLESRVARFEVNQNRCRDKKGIVSNIPAASGYHIGGQLEFAGGKLFVSVGEGHNAADAQDKDNRLGKVLRYNPDGSIPRANPFSKPGNRSPVWSYGHRNGFGLTHKPGTQKLYESENGPDCDDELNRIKRGRNYGWGSGYACGTSGVGPRPKRPLHRWGSVIAVTDPWWYKGRMKRLNGDIYAGGFSDGALHRLVMNGKGTRVRRDKVIHSGSGGIVDVAKGPGGWLYFMTASSIYRIVPA